MKVKRKKDSRIYRISYSKDGETTCEIHARNVRTSEIFGFVEISEFVQPKKTSIIIRPDSARVEEEFRGVFRTLIPIRDIRRIDVLSEEEFEVEAGPLKVVEFRARGG
ncbi:MAG: DUF1820 family protein [Candidatus Hydrogenedentota bacterium]|nr:MAG: DUF1820 family protein [Candidatus Hydrogenedentota bacterium]